MLLKMETAFLHLAIIIIISLSPLKKGVNDFAFVVGKRVENETTQLCLIL